MDGAGRIKLVIIFGQNEILSSVKFMELYDGVRNKPDSQMGSEGKTRKKRIGHYCPADRMKTGHRCPHHG